MARVPEEINSREISSLIQKLISFLGPNEVRRHLQKYENSLRQSGPFFREYYIRNRHPWWSAFKHYFELEKGGKSLRKNLTKELTRLGGDAKMISTLQKFMPDSVKKKYRRDLVDDNAACAYLFEINIAWHYFLENFHVQWDEHATGRHSDLVIKAPDFTFEVECKRISLDTARKIKRKDFFRFVEKLIQFVDSERYTGGINIILNDRLPSSDRAIRNLVEEVVGEIKVGNTNGNFQTTSASLTLDLKCATGKTVNMYERYSKLREIQKPNATAFIYAKSVDQLPVDPIEIMLMSKKSDDYFKEIKSKVTDAAKNQLNKSMPGFIVCFLEDVPDLRGLQKDSTLQLIASDLFLKEDLSHVAAIGYSSESIIHREVNNEAHYNHGLIFRNPNCKFEEAKKFPFFSKDIVDDDQADEFRGQHLK